MLGLLAMLEGRRAKPAAQALASFLDSRTLLPAAEVLVRWADRTEPASTCAERDSDWPVCRQPGCFGVCSRASLSERSRSTRVSVRTASNSTSC